MRRAARTVRRRGVAAGLGVLLAAVLVVPMPTTPVAATVAGAPAEVSARVEAWLAGDRPSFVDDQGQRVRFDPATFERPELGVPALRQFSLDYNRANPAQRPGEGQLDAFLLRPLAAGDTEAAPVRLYGDAAAAKDPGLDAYIALPPAARALDLAIRTNIRHPAWTAAEYKGPDGRDLPYRADYFVHFAPAGPGRTSIQVIGYDALVERGAEWSTRGGDGLSLLPRRQPRLWMVKPSHADGQRVLAGLVRGAGAR